MKRTLLHNNILPRNEWQRVMLLNPLCLLLLAYVPSSNIDGLFPPPNSPMQKMKMKMNINPATLTSPATHNSSCFDDRWPLCLLAAAG